MRDVVVGIVIQQAIPDGIGPGLMEGLEQSINDSSSNALRHHNELDTTALKLRQIGTGATSFPRWPAGALIGGLGYTVHLIDGAWPQVINTILQAETKSFDPDLIKW